MSWSDIWSQLPAGTWQTLGMVGIAALVTLLVGLPVGVLLVLTDRGGLLRGGWLSAVVNKLLSAVVNIGRSLPFVILMVALIPFTRWVVGTSLGWQAAAVPLAIGGIPFFARLVESAVREVDGGLVEAVHAMGGSTWTVVRKALLPESLPALVSGLTTTVIALVGYSAMAGTVGGGGLGSLAITNGYMRFDTRFMIVIVVELIVLVTLLQLIGDGVARAIDHRGGAEHRSALGRLLSRLLGRAFGPLFARRPVRVATASAAALAVVAGGVAWGVGGSGGGAASSSAPLTVVASPVPHAQILEYVQKNLAAKAGLKLKVKVVDDYITPDTAVEDGSADANYFQHVPYMDDFNKSHGTHIVSVGAVHLEPLGLYSHKVKKAEQLTDGATVAVPNDATNEGRALKLLADHGLIGLKSGVGTGATVQDVTSNPKHLNFKELDAAQLPRSLDDVDAAIVNGNYALDAGLNPDKDSILLESAQNNPYANVLSVKDGNQDDPRVRKLLELLQSDQVQQYIQRTFHGAVIPAA
jgi:YaeC family lipoprotein